jgi:GNAT superfamily N-acetyltransferase
MAVIKPLRDFPAYAPILAYWSYRQWYRKRDIGFDHLIKSYKKRASAKHLPISWIAIEEDMPVGMVTLKENDLWSRKDINPWLASLYVEPDFRRRGIGEQLINAVIVKARKLGLARLHLFLDSAELVTLERYYIKRGWSFFEEALDNDGNETKIFLMTLS